MNDIWKQTEYAEPERLEETQRQELLPLRLETQLMSVRKIFRQDKANTRAIYIATQDRSRIRIAALELMWSV